MLAQMLEQEAVGTGWKAVGVNEMKYRLGHGVHRQRACQ
jgi:hypothetical protein